MKNVFLIVMTLLVSNLFSQKLEKERYLSNAEQFSLKSGALIQREFTDVGSLKGAKFLVLTISDLLSGNKTKALKIETTIQKSYGSTEKSAVLDADEVEGFLKSLRMIEEKILPSTAAQYTEVEYKSRGGFKGGCFSDDKKGWSVFLKLDKYDSDSYIFLKKEDLPSIIKLFEDAKSKM